MDFSRTAQALSRLNRLHSDVNLAQAFTDTTASFQRYLSSNTPETATMFSDALNRLRSAVEKTDIRSQFTGAEARYLSALGADTFLAPTLGDRLEECLSESGTLPSNALSALQALQGEFSAYNQSVRATVSFLRKYAPELVDSPRRDVVGFKTIPLSMLLPVERGLDLDILASESGLLQTHLRVLLEVACGETGPVSIASVSQGSIDLLFDLHPDQALFLLGLADSAMSIASSALSIRALSKTQAAEYLPQETRAAIEQQADAHEENECKSLADRLLDEANAKEGVDKNRLTELSSSFRSAIRFVVGKIRIGLEVEAALSVDYRIDKGGRAEASASSAVKQAIEKSQRLRKRRLDDKRETPLLPRAPEAKAPEPPKRRTPRKKKPE